VITLTMTDTSDFVGTLESVVLPPVDEGKARLIYSQAKPGKAITQTAALKRWRMTYGVKHASERLGQIRRLERHKGLADDLLHNAAADGGSSFRCAIAVAVATTAAAVVVDGVGIGLHSAAAR